MLLALLLAAAGGDTVRYTVAFPNPAHHEARIVAEFPANGRDTLEVWMSRSSPGRYALHEFAKNVYDVEATDPQGRALAVRRPDPYRWLVVARGRRVRFAYTLFADRADGTYSQIDVTHAHLNMPATFAWARGLGGHPVQVRFDPPPGSGWRAATQLLPTGNPLVWAAPDLAYFMDSPVELSDFSVRSWTVSGPGGRIDTIRIALHHQGTEAQADSFAEALRRVAAEQIAIFGESARFDHHLYTFLADYLPWASRDGMEHRNSTVLSAPGSLARDAESLLRTASHELFHAWNMERIRSAELEPFDFTRANASPTLWFGEGFTSYYDRLTMRRAGLLSDSAYAAALAEGLNAVMLAPGRRFFSPIEMSLQAPFVDAATSIDPTNQTNTFLSYYTWGAAIGLGLDLSLRGRSAGQSLDGYMRLVWDRFGRPLRRYRIRRAYTVDDLERTLADYTGDPGFARDHFARYVRGRDIPEFASLLVQVGMRMRPVRAGAASAGPVVLAADTAGVLVTAATVAGTPLYDAGVDRGDRIVSAGRAAVPSPAAWEALVASAAPGDTIPIVVLRRGREIRATLRLTADPRIEVIPFELAGETVSDSQRAARAAWLGSRAR
jgi:predicted metalloprotease with PDZ domain